MAKEKINGTLVPADPDEQSRVVIDNRLVKFIECVTDAELEELRAEIRRRGHQLAGMKKLEQVVAAALGKAQPRAPHGSKKKAAAAPAVLAPEAMMEKRRRVANALKDGARNGGYIITNCGIQPAQLAEVMTCAFFTQSTSGWHLTTQGRQNLL